MAMNRRIRYTYETLHNDDNAKVYTYIIIVFNIVYAILGAMMLSAGFYISLDEDFREYVSDIDLENYMPGVYILMVAGALVLIQSFFGVCGAYLKKSSMLQIFFVMMAICFVLEIVGASYLLANGKAGTRLEIQLREKFIFLISRYNQDQTARRSMDIIQEWIGCCGASGVVDYVRWNMVVPSSCFNPVTGNAWYRDSYGFVGCIYGFTKYVEKGTGWICGLALILAFFQIFGLIATYCLMSVKKDFRSKSLGDLTTR